jgi:hypothetical protein
MPENNWIPQKGESSEYAEGFILGERYNSHQFLENIKELIK